MRNLMLGALASAALLAACSGGGGRNGGVSGPPGFGAIPTTAPATASPSPTAAPQAAHISIQWTGSLHSSGASASALLRRPLDVSSTEPIAFGIQAPSGSSAAVGGNLEGEPNSFSAFNSANVTISATNASGTPLPVTTATATVAAPVAAVSPVPSPSPGTQAFIAYAATGDTSTSTTTLNVSATDPVTGQAVTQAIPVKVYDHFGVDARNVYHDTGTAYSFDSGSVVAAASCSTADVCISAPQSGVATKITFQYGVAQVPESTAFSSYASSMGVTFGATTLTIPAITSDRFLIFKTAAGRSVGWFIQITSCSGDQTLCDTDGNAFGTYKVSDTSGTFAN